MGRYDHPGDRANPAALDPNFQGFARLATDRDGQFKFRSIKPKDYDTPIGRRTPHIHFSIDGHAERLVTQMYFPGEPLNDSDFLLKNADPTRKRDRRGDRPAVRRSAGAGLPLDRRARRQG